MNPGVEAARNHDNLKEPKPDEKPGLFIVEDHPSGETVYLDMQEGGSPNLYYYDDNESCYDARETAEVKKVKAEYEAGNSEKLGEFV